MTINYAHISYQDTPKQYFTVPIEDVKLSKELDEFLPAHAQDFDPKHVYYTKYRDCDTDCDENHAHEEYHKSTIYCLGETEEEIEQLVDAKRRKKPLRVQSDSSPQKKTRTKNRVKKSTAKEDLLAQRSRGVLSDLGVQTLRSNLLDTSSEDDEQSLIDSDDSTQEPASKKMRVKCKALEKQLEEKNKEIANLYKITNELKESMQQRRLEVLQNVQLPVMATPLDQQNQGANDGNAVINNNRGANHEAVDNNNVNNQGANHGAVDNDLNNQGADDDGVFNNNGDPLTNNGANLPENNGNRQADNVELEKINKQWIDKLLTESLEYYQVNGPGNAEKSKRYSTVEGGQKYIGEGITMTEVNMGLMFAERTFTKFIRSCACVIWTPRELMNRAVDIQKVVNKVRYEGRSPVKGLERNRLRLLISLGDDYLRNKKLSYEERLRTLRTTTTHISKKIRDLKTEETIRIEAEKERRSKEETIRNLEERLNARRALFDD